MAINLVFNDKNAKKPTLDGIKPTFKEAFLDGLIFNNLSLVDFVGLTPIIAGGSTVINGLILSAATVIVLVLVTLFAAIMGGRLKKSIAAAVYTLLSASVVFFLMWAGFAVFPEKMLAVGIIFPLVAVNGITLNRIRNFRDKGVAATVGDALGKGLGFTGVMFVVCAFRELFGYGTLFDIPMPLFDQFHNGVIARLPGGFFIMAALALLIRFVTLKRARQRDKGGSENESAD